MSQSSASVSGYGPGTQYPVPGQVNRGQELVHRDYDDVWIMGDLVGERTGVWIHKDYLAGC